MSRRVTALAGVLIIAAVVAVLAFILPSPQPTAADRLIDYLDTHGVTYRDRSSMLRLADTLCTMRARGADTDGFLLTAFSRPDATTIQWGVFNGGYCG